MKNCNQCGKCCIKYADGGLSATREEIDLWEVFNPHIYQYVHNDEIWFDPTTQQPLTTCPFLGVEPAPLNSQKPIKYICSIYDDRPEDCRHYPTSISEMIRDECEMIELVDIEQPKRAQIKLDALMSDSRPAKK